MLSLCPLHFLWQRMWWFLLSIDFIGVFVAAVASAVSSKFYACHIFLSKFCVCTYLSKLTFNRFVLLLCLGRFLYFRVEVFGGVDRWTKVHILARLKLFRYHRIVRLCYNRRRGQFFSWLLTFDLRSNIFKQKFLGVGDIVIALFLNN